MMQVFSTDVQLNEAAVARGMNALGVAAKITGEDTEVYRLVVVGRYTTEKMLEGEVFPLQCILFYRHIPTGLIGFLPQPIEYSFLSDLERLGMPQ